MSKYVSDGVVKAIALGTQDFREAARTLESAIENARDQSEYEEEPLMNVIHPLSQLGMEYWVGALSQNIARYTYYVDGLIMLDPMLELAFNPKLQRTSA